LVERTGQVRGNGAARCHRFAAAATLLAASPDVEMQEEMPSSTAETLKERFTASAWRSAA
jgi:hypothetical protein